MHVAGWKNLTILTLLCGCPATWDYCDRLYDAQLSFIVDCDRGVPIDIGECRRTLPEGCTRRDLQNLHRELDCWAGRHHCGMEEAELEEVYECLYDVPDRPELCAAVHQRLFE